MVKKAVSLVLALVLIASFTACQSNTSVEDTTPPTGYTFPPLSDTVPSTENTTLSPTPNPDIEPSPSKTAPPQPVAVEELWHWYSQLEGVRREGYIELYNAAMAWLTDDDASSESYDFSYEMTTPGFTMDDYEILRFVSEDNPLIFSFFTLAAAESNEKVTYYCAFSFTHNEIIQMAREMESEAGRILSGLTADMSDYEKYHYIANALCQTVSYDYYASDIRESHELLEEDDFMKMLWAGKAYGAIVRKLAVCEGYAFAYQYLCNRAGLWCISSSGASSFGAHLWNMIRLDDGYYWVDTTWMDDGFGDRYFCLTDEQLAIDHTPDYPPVIPVCNATKYAYMNGDIGNLSS